MLGGALQCITGIYDPEGAWRPAWILDVFKHHKQPYVPSARVLVGRLRIQNKNLMMKNLMKPSRTHTRKLETDMESYQGHPRLLRTVVLLSSASSARNTIRTCERLYEASAQALEKVQLQMPFC
ncbi:uncharacterized protein LOC108350924 isoform X4 [Rattus norvegicus]|uniref:uncharacterized protein LOC108350924 isoform X4 n=1 Tax=Rattus norvegicus TaxID=10116 RepID=UPI002FD7F6F0